MDLATVLIVGAVMFSGTATLLIKSTYRVRQ